ncbi:hypothetical protein [Prosthecodimorpha staleyi]|uniref:Uncharacterized protein n=1 Tax=Prosthecodimorpha staleyi TaxID=2840188 RepID=A0A947D4F2_9HYPH|nr:hypothetical protein [Prosthecodimorpha staleyi]MBT9290034.1 hypothetical protein [Prosthecodimorpha staleyi]
MAEIGLRLIGVFYLAAAFYVGRTLITGRSLTAMLEALAQGPATRATRWRDHWLAAGTIPVGLGGMMLAVLSWLALPLFLIGLAQQVLYLGLVAPRWLDPHDEPVAAERAATRNAAVVYSVATALVAMAAADGRLLPLGAFDPALVAAIMTLAAVLVAGFAFLYLRAGRLTDYGGGGDDGDDDAIDRADEQALPARAYAPPAPDMPPSYSVMADFGCHPVWSIRPADYGSVDPADLDISRQLEADLARWADEFEQSLDPENPAEPRWTTEAHAEHEARGRDLAERLAAEFAASGRAGWQVFAFSTDAGHVRVSPSGEVRPHDAHS